MVVLKIEAKFSTVFNYIHVGLCHGMMNTLSNQ